MAATGAVDSRVVTQLQPGPQVEQAGELRSSRVESLRALAALAVVVGHVFGASNGYGPVVFQGFLHRALLGGGFAVFLFFTLSGYLLYRPFVARDLGAGARVDLRRYARNRAVRILPLYYVVLVVFLLLFEDGGTFTQWWRFGLFAQSFFSDTVATVDGPMWSLVVELHFYVLLPVLAWAIARVSRGSAARTGVALAVLGAVALAVRLLLFTLPDQPGRVREFSLPVTFWFFVPGMLLAVLRVHWETAGPPRWLRGPLASSTAWLVASLPFWALVIWRYDLSLLVAPASFLVVGACALPLRSGLPVRALAWRPLAVLGTASYSLYLWHEPIVNNVVAASWAPSGFLPLLAILLVPCCVLALVSYRVIEAPWLRLRRGWTSGTQPYSRSMSVPVPSPPPQHIVTNP